MSNHGPLFDEFHAESGEHHGGSLADEYAAGPTAAAGSLDATTPSYRDVTANGSGHGERWDEFGFRQMPEHYGRSLDSNFDQPAMGDGVHGTWMDVFRGGRTEVRADVNGIANVEAVVIECHPDHAVLELKRPRHADGGGRVEVNIGQIREWRYATQQGQASETRKPTANVGNTPARDRASTADAPSAHNATAHGGARTDAGDTTAATETVFAGKTTDTELDVEKASGTCVTCKKPATQAYTAGRAGVGPRFKACGEACAQKHASKMTGGSTNVTRVGPMLSKSVDEHLLDLRKLAGLED